MTVLGLALVVVGLILILGGNAFAGLLLTLAGIVIFALDA